MDKETTYAELLRGAIDSEKTSRNKLAPALAEKTGNKEKTEYRSLGKYLSGKEVPEPERAAILAVLLQEPRLALVPSAGERRRGGQAEVKAQVGELERRLARVERAIPQVAAERAAELAAEAAEAGETAREAERLRQDANESRPGQQAQPG